MNTSQYLLDSWIYKRAKEAKQA